MIQLNCSRVLLSWQRTCVDRSGMKLLATLAAAFFLLTGIYEVQLPIDRKTDRLSNAILKLDPENATGVEWKKKEKKKEV
jgi:hypothetical protein